jgi:hypothetical protein
LLKEIVELPDPRGDGRSRRTVARVTSAFARELNGLIVTGSALGIVHRKLSPGTGPLAGELARCTQAKESWGGARFRNLRLTTGKIGKPQ